MKDSIDLIPREVSEQRSAQGRLLGLIVLGGGLLGAVILVGFAMAARARAVEAAVVPLRDQVAQLRQLQNRVQPLEAQLRQSLERQGLVQKLLREPAWNALLSDLASAVTGDVWINTFEVRQPLEEKEAGIPLESPTLTISGTAATEQELLRFMNAFATSPQLMLLAPRQSRQSRAQDEAGVGRIEFVLEGTMNLAGDLP